MRANPLFRHAIPVFLVTLALPGLVIPAHGQVSVDLHALDQAAPPKSAPRAAPPHHRAVTSGRPEAAKAEPPAKTEPAAPASPHPELPSAAPPLVSLAPGAPAIPAPPVPPPPIVADAGGEATPVSGGLRVAFQAGSSDLNPATAEALGKLAKTAGHSDASTFNVNAYAAATPDDPSAARRLSLARALAVREALMTGGVSSARIYVRALGSGFAEGPPDRTDVLVLGANAPPNPPPPQRESQPQPSASR